MKKIFFVLAIVLSSSIVAKSGCGDDYLCCEGIDGFYVSVATCVNDIRYDCQWTACPDGGGDDGGQFDRPFWY